MKKFFMGFCMLATGLVLASCNKKQDVKVDGGAGTEAPVAQVVDFAKVLEQAKTEGANWNVDQWKEAFTNFLKGIKPKVEKIAEIMGKTKDAEKGNEAEVAAAVLEVATEQEEFQSAMTEFEETAKATEAGKQVLADEEWGNKQLQKLGLDKLFETIQAAQ
jgi:DNA-binding transcriptional regulator PaaX